MKEVDLDKRRKTNKVIGVTFLIAMTIMVLMLLNETGKLTWVNTAIALTIASALGAMFGTRKEKAEQVQKDILEELKKKNN
jgi:hypothetical protein